MWVKAHRFAIDGNDLPELETARQIALVQMIGHFRLSSDLSAGPAIAGATRFVKGASGSPPVRKFHGNSPLNATITVRSSTPSRGFDYAAGVSEPARLGYIGGPVNTAS